MNELLKSRRFVTALLASVVTLVLYFVGKYALGALEDVQMVLNVLMPLALALIAAYTIDDIATIHSRAQVEIKQAELATIQQQVRLETLRSQSAKIE